MEYRGIKLVDIPSGMGGAFPAAVAAAGAEETQVICLHEEFYPNWLLTVKTSELKPFSYRITPRMKRIIDSRLQGAA